MEINALLSLNSDDQLEWLETRFKKEAKDDKEDISSYIAGLAWDKPLGSILVLDQSILEQMLEYPDSTDLGWAIKERLPSTSDERAIAINDGTELTPKELSEAEAIARKRQISLVDTKYYHCISRCVRRAFLCGEDRFTGQSYEHRRGWVEDKLLELAKVFCIDVCAYAVMSNHTHLVLYVDDKKANRLNDKAIVIRWHKLCKGTVLTQKYIQGEKLSKAELIFFKTFAKLFSSTLLRLESNNFC